MSYFRGDLQAWHDQFVNAEPFEHLVLDGLWDDSELVTIAAEFAPPEDPRWVTYPQPEEWGKRCGGVELWREATTSWFKRMFTNEDIHHDLEVITGIETLLPDIIGGGQHLSSEGARLESHVDFNIHPSDDRFERRLNFLVFLNKNWRDEDGGVLYLGKNREVAVSPQFNRTVIFATSDKSYHGHPDPIVGANFRKSLACYFYAPRRESTTDSHSTM
ncbi:MAG TPA: 2OG-Fe(II) oxygenase, partial [Ktedonobacteraceae bacterium]|nr:2OG-Fe(II) oxygenase [Ktedonobacteraceae bacterium]